MVIKLKLNYFWVRRGIAVGDLSGIWGGSFNFTVSGLFWNVLGYVMRTNSSYLWSLPDPKVGNHFGSCWTVMCCRQWMLWETRTKTQTRTTEDNDSFLLEELLSQSWLSLTITQLQSQLGPKWVTILVRDQLHSTTFLGIKNTPHAGSVAREHKHFVFAVLH